MSGNLIDLRRRVHSVKNTQKITRAMKTVAAAKLRRSVTDLNRNRAYMNQLKKIISRLMTESLVAKSPFCKKRDQGDRLLVVISSDKGLCGAFNTNIIKAAMEYLHENQGESETVHFVSIGSKISRYMKRKELPSKKSYGGILSHLQGAQILEISQYLQDVYFSENFKRIVCLSAHFVSASKQEIRTQQVLPLEYDLSTGSEDEETVEYILEPSAEELIQTLLPLYINTQIFGLFAESSAAEHSSRMIAMDLATKNASDMIRSLTLTLNKLRQSLITKELLEIITATEALRK